MSKSTGSGSGRVQWDRVGVMAGGKQDGKRRMIAPGRRRLENGSGGGHSTWIGACG